MNITLRTDSQLSLLCITTIILLTTTRTHRHILCIVDVCECLSVCVCVDKILKSESKHSATLWVVAVSVISSMFGKEAQGWFYIVSVLVSCVLCCAVLSLCVCECISYGEATTNTYKSNSFFIQCVLFWFSLLWQCVVLFLLHFAYSVYNVTTHKRLCMSVCVPVSVDVNKYW